MREMKMYPGLKAFISKIAIQRPEGRCSLRS